MTDFDDELDRALKVDPLLEAEKMTSKSYKVDRETSGLGFSLYMQHGKYKEDLLKLSSDSYLHMNFEDHKAEAVGEFLPKWVERPWLWLLTYMDVKEDSYDHEAITAERISRLPEHVREAITP